MSRFSYLRRQLSHQRASIVERLFSPTSSRSTHSSVFIEATSLLLVAALKGIVPALEKATPRYLEVWHYYFASLVSSSNPSANSVVEISDFHGRNPEKIYRSPCMSIATYFFRPNS